MFDGYLHGAVNFSGLYQLQWQCKCFLTRGNQQITSMKDFPDKNFCVQLTQEAWFPAHMLLHHQSQGRGS